LVTIYNTRQRVNYIWICYAFSYGFKHLQSATCNMVHRLRKEIMTNKKHLRTQFIPLVPLNIQCRFKFGCSFRPERPEPAAHKFTAGLSSYVKVAQTYMWTRFESQLTFDHRQCDRPVMRCHDDSTHRQRGVSAVGITCYLATMPIID